MKTENTHTPTLTDTFTTLCGIATGVLTCLKYPRGSEAQVRCLEEVADSVRFIEPHLPAPVAMTVAAFEAEQRLNAAAPCLLSELCHLVRLLEPLEQSGALQVPGLATLNAARAAIAKATK